MFDVIPQNSSLIIAISGGPDSVFLLHQLVRVQKSKNLQLHLAHFNHQIRNQASDADEKFVRQLAEKFNLPLSISRSARFFKTKTGKFSEEQMRQQRYKFLQQTRQTLGADFIVTAHHFDDQIETIIFNFIRGTGPQGLTGMSAQKNHILRPLLDTPKEKIIKYLKKHRIHYQTDKSNLDLNYQRNLIRHKLIPLFQKINPQFDKSIQQLALTLSSQQSYIKQVAQTFVRPTHQNSRPDRLIMTLTQFKKLHAAIQTEIIKQIIAPHVPPDKQLTAKVIYEVQNIILHSRPNSQKILFDALSIYKKNDKIYLRLIT